LRLGITRFSTQTKGTILVREAGYRCRREDRCRSRRRVDGRSAR
jgi:hypothetical protein